MIEILIEILWLVQIFYNFIKVPDKIERRLAMQEPFWARQYIKCINKRSNLPFPPPDEPMHKKIARRYTCTLFPFDFISTVPVLLINIFFIKSPNAVVYKEICHLFRIVRIKQVTIPLKWVVSKVIRQ